MFTNTRQKYQFILNNSCQSDNVKSSVTKSSCIRFLSICSSLNNYDRTTKNLKHNLVHRGHNPQKVEWIIKDARKTATDLNSLHVKLETLRLHQVTILDFVCHLYQILQMWSPPSSKHHGLLWVICLIFPPSVFHLEMEKKLLTFWTQKLFILKYLTINLQVLTNYSSFPKCRTAWTNVKDGHGERQNVWWTPYNTHFIHTGIGPLELLLYRTSSVVITQHKLVNHQIW